MSNKKVYICDIFAYFRPSPPLSSQLGPLVNLNIWKFSWDPCEWRKSVMFLLIPTLRCWAKAGFGPVKQNVDPSLISNHLRAECPTRSWAIVLLTISLKPRFKEFKVYIVFFMRQNVSISKKKTTQTGVRCPVVSPLMCLSHSASFSFHSFSSSSQCIISQP